MKVKLISLKIKRLYGCYDYEVKFNPDVTFLYGENGCGKTTILNITEAIITGQLYKLANQDFRRIDLSYAKNGNPSNTKTIEILMSEDLLSVKFENLKETLNVLPATSDRSSIEIQQYYFNKYEVLEKIRDTFNYVYLPLNRTIKKYGNDFDDREIYFLQKYKNRQYTSRDGDRNTDLDLTMIQVKELIKARHSRISADLSRLSDEFRNRILRSLLKVNRDDDTDILLNDMMGKKEATLEEVEKTRDVIMKMLEELSVMPEDELQNYSDFFEAIIKDYSEYIHDENDRYNGFELFLRLQEISKMRELVRIAEDIEKQKNKIREPIELFIQTMNQFIGGGIDNKEVRISTVGNISFITSYNKKGIDIQNLSSGEKQLLIFFANLIFSVKKGQSGIFVVDEPELSLHLSWQRLFVETTMGLNKNIQLIFATHAPEIIGRRREKMFRLDKKLTF